MNSEDQFATGGGGLPTFILGGTAAGGTSFLAAVLVQHPEIYLPKQMRPEPHYFYKSWEYSKGLEYYRARWFSDVPADCTIVGERSSSYLFGGGDVAERMWRAIPDVKLMFTLRNPIERTWANYRYTVLEGLEDLSFEEALRQEPLRVAQQTGIWAEIQPYNYTGRGFYGRQIREFRRYFDPSRILLVKSEALARDTERELDRIYTFLGVRERDFRAIRPPEHSSVGVKDPVLQRQMRQYFGDRFDSIIEAVRREEPMPPQATDGDTAAVARLCANLHWHREPMPRAARDYLSDLFAEDLRELREYVDFDISDWVGDRA